MAFTILHFCILLSSLACIGRGRRPSFDSELKLNLGWTTASQDSRASDERAVPMRSGGYAAGGKAFAVTSDYGADGSLKYSIFDYYRTILETIRARFTRKQGPSRLVEHDQKMLFVFGDSLFDGGNNKYINNSTYDGSNYPYGYTYFPRATGRLCDGRIVPDFIAECGAASSSAIAAARCRFRLRSQLRISGKHCPGLGRR